MTVKVNDEVSTSSFTIDGKKSDTAPKLARRKRAEISETVQTIEFERIADDETKRDVWYCKDEYEFIKERNSLLVKMMRMGKLIESDQHSFRGLEHKLKDGFRLRKSNKIGAYHAVLEEQDRQIIKGISDQEAVAQAYYRASKTARETAFLIALRDAEESFAYQAPEVDELSDVTLDEQDQGSSPRNLRARIQGEEAIERSSLMTILHSTATVQQHNSKVGALLNRF